MFGGSLGLGFCKVQNHQCNDTDYQINSAEPNNYVFYGIADGAHSLYNCLLKTASYGIAQLAARLVGLV